MIEIEHKPLSLEDIFEGFIKNPEVSENEKKEVVDFILRLLLLINIAYRSANILEKEKREKLKGPKHLLEVMGYEREILLHRFKNQAIETLDKAVVDRAEFMKLQFIWPFFLDLPYFDIIDVRKLTRILNTIVEIMPETRTQIDTLNPLVLRNKVGRVGFNINLGFSDASNMRKAFQYFPRLLIDTNELKHLSERFLNLVIENDMLYRLIIPLTSYDNDVLQLSNDSEPTAELFLGTRTPSLHKSSSIYFRTLTTPDLTLYSLPQISLSNNRASYEIMDTILTKNVSISGASNFFKNRASDEMRDMTYKPRIRIVFDNVVRKTRELFAKVEQLRKSETQDVKTAFRYLNDIHNIAYLLRLHDLLTHCGINANSDLVKISRDLTTLFDKVDQKIFNSQIWIEYIEDIATGVDERIVLEFLHQISTVRASIFDSLSIYGNVSLKDRYSEVSVAYKKVFSKDVEIALNANPKIRDVLYQAKQEQYLTLHYSITIVADKNVWGVRVHEPTSIIALSPTILSCIDNVLMKENHGSANSQ